MLPASCIVSCTCMLQAGEGELPTNELMEKQRLIIDRLRDRIELDVDGLDRLAPDELQLAVDSAVKRVRSMIRRCAVIFTVILSAADHADEGEGPGDTAAEDADHRPRALRRVPAAREPELPAVHVRRDRGTVAAYRNLDGIKATVPLICRRPPVRITRRRRSGSGWRRRRRSASTRTRTGRSRRRRSTRRSPCCRCTCSASWAARRSARAATSSSTATSSNGRPRATTGGPSIIQFDHSVLIRSNNQIRIFKTLFTCSDLRAALELAVDSLAAICKRHNLDQTTQPQTSGKLSVYSSDDEGTEVDSKKCI